MWVHVHPQKSRWLKCCGTHILGQELARHQKNLVVEGTKVSLCDSVFRRGTPIELVEGRVSFDELVQELCAAMPVKCLLKELIPGLILTCRDEVRALRDDVPGNLNPQQRLAPYGSCDRVERLLFVGDTNPFSIVSLLAMEDGNPKRQLRRILRDPELREVGIAHSISSKGEPITVIYLCSGFKEKSAPEDDTMLTLQKAREW